MTRKSEHLPWCSGLADLMTRWRRADAGQVSRASFVASCTRWLSHTRLAFGHDFHFLFMSSFVIADVAMQVQEVVASSMHLHVATPDSLLPSTMMLMCGVSDAIQHQQYQPDHHLTTSPLPCPLETLWLLDHHSWITQVFPLLHHHFTHQSIKLPTQPPPNPTSRTQSTMPPDICCIHPHRSLPPTEPARPSGLTLDRIFAVAAAALPEDHPHSLKLPLSDHRRSPKHLIRSPSFANKLKGQLRRRATIKSLKAEVYDEDARVMTSEEVVARVGAVAALERERRRGGPPTLRLRKS